MQSMAVFCAVHYNLTLDGMEDRAMDRAQEVLENAPADSLQRLWKAAIWVCADYYPDDPFRETVLDFEWPENLKQKILEILAERDAVNFPDYEDEDEEEEKDPEPYCPPFERPAMRGRSKSVREEDVLADKRADTLAWMAWCQRNKSADFYRAALEKMVLEAPWAQAEDLQTLRQCSTDAQWAETREKLKTAPYWESRQEDVERISGERGKPQQAGDSPSA